MAPSPALYAMSQAKYFVTVVRDEMRPDFVSRELMHTSQSFRLAMVKPSAKKLSATFSCHEN